MANDEKNKPPKAASPKQQIINSVRGIARSFRDATIDALKSLGKKLNAILKSPYTWLLSGLLFYMATDCWYFAAAFTSIATYIIGEKEGFRDGWLEGRRKLRQTLMATKGGEIKK